LQKVEREFVQRQSKDLFIAINFSVRNHAFWNFVQRNKWVKKQLLKLTENNTKLKQNVS
jgi:hypothetical protein